MLGWLKNLLGTSDYDRGIAEAQPLAVHPQAQQRLSVDELDDLYNCGPDDRHGDLSPLVLHRGLRIKDLREMLKATRSNMPRADVLD